MADGDINNYLDANKEGTLSSAVMFTSGSLEVAEMMASDHFASKPYTPADVIAIAQMVEATRRWLEDKHFEFEREEARQAKPKK